MSSPSWKLSFAQQVFTGGYRWQSWESKNERKYAGEDGELLAYNTNYLLTLNISRTPHHFRSYDPFESEPTLFRSFAKLWRNGKVADSDIILFADRYGPLDHTLTHAVSVVAMENGNYLDWIGVWSLFARGMSHAVGLLDKVKRIEAKATQWNEPTEYEQLRNDLEKLISCYMSRAAFSLILARNCEGDDVVAGKPYLSLVPTRLIDVLWLQIANAYTEGREWRPCKECDEYFPIGQGAHNRSKLYCSNLCTMKAYRRNRKNKERDLRDRIRRSLPADQQSDPNAYEVLSSWLDLPNVTVKLVERMLEELAVAPISGDFRESGMVILKQLVAQDQARLSSKRKGTRRTIT